MIVEVKPSNVVLRDVDDFIRFHVAAPSDAPVESLDRWLRDAGAGRADGNGAFIDAAWLRRSGAGTDAWTEGFERMLEYAAAKGWLDGSYIQAHVEATL